MPSVPRSTPPNMRRSRTATARKERLTPVAFATVRSDLLWKRSDSHGSLFSNFHIAPRLPQIANSWLNYQPHVLTELPRDLS